MTKKHQKYDGTPKFDGSDYRRWKLLVQMWEKVTDIDVDKRGAALIPNMSGRAQDVALAVSSDNITVKEVTTLLDKVPVTEYLLVLVDPGFRASAASPLFLNIEA